MVLSDDSVEKIALGAAAAANQRIATGCKYVSVWSVVISMLRKSSVVNAHACVCTEVLSQHHLLAGIVEHSEQVVGYVVPPSSNPTCTSVVHSHIAARQ